MAKHEEHEEHENHERWLVSYADFITLLFAFFVVMYAISQTDQQRAIQVEQAVKFALHIKGEGGSDTALSLGGRSGQLVAPPATARSPDTAKEAKRRRVQKKIAAATPAGRPAVLVLVEGQRLIGLDEYDVPPGSSQVDSKDATRRIPTGEDEGPHIRE